MENRVAVIGGGGHVGLGLCLVLADNGCQVSGIDLNESVNQSIMQGKLPFHEDGAQEVLDRVLEAGRLQMCSDLSAAKTCGVIVIVVGTPIDENLNPVFKPLNKLCTQLARQLQRGQLLVLRSTVSPGTTRRVRQLLESLSGFKESEDFHLVCAPERVAQGHALREIVSFPQLVGSFSSCGFQVAETFFSKFIKNRCFQLEPEEAEIGKLITNMSRYVSFALANEYYLLADSFNVNIHRIIDSCTFQYPRLQVPNPGPNVGGPCLYKDGFFLVESLPFTELISSAFKINEGMPHGILKKIQQHPWIKKITILGMAFKGGSDDTRNSLSFKLRKQLVNGGYEVACFDPKVSEYNHPGKMAGSDCIVLMTPHREFHDLRSLVGMNQKNPCLIADIWGFWEIMRGRSRNGFFFAEEVPL